MAKSELAGPKKGQLRRSQRHEEKWGDEAKKTKDTTENNSAEKMNEDATKKAKSGHENGRAKAKSGRGKK